MHKHTTIFTGCVGVGVLVFAKQLTVRTGYRTNAKWFENRLLIINIFNLQTLPTSRRRCCNGLAADAVTTNTTATTTTSLPHTVKHTKTKEHRHMCMANVISISERLKLHRVRQFCQITLQAIFIGISRILMMRFFVGMDFLTLILSETIKHLVDVILAQDKSQMRGQKKPEGIEHCRIIDNFQ